MIGIMLLDHMGMIRSTNRHAAALFRASSDRLIGRSIASLMPDIPFSLNSPGFNAKSIAHLCEGNDWRTMKCIDLHDRKFALRFGLTRINDGYNPGNSICYYVKLMRDGGQA